MSFSVQELETMVDQLDTYTADEQAVILQLVDELHNKHVTGKCSQDLIAFCCHMQANYKVGSHHRILSRLLMDVDEGTKDRIIVNIPPRHGKSHLVSIYYPAWYIGRNPGKQVLMASHTTDLAVNFSRKVRNLIESPAYQQVFPGVHLTRDSKSAGRWNTTNGCEFYATGVGAALAGRGSDLLLVDDPHNEQDIINGNFDVFEKAYEWFTYGARTRLMPQGRIILVQTRWHSSDLTGRLVNDMQANELADQYEVVEFPAIIEVEPGVQKPLWPEFFDLPALLRTKASMPTFQWNAQYQQNPTAEEAAIIKREWWSVWESPTPPTCEFIIMTLDAAAESHNRADFTGITTWGVFFNEETDCNNIILLNVIKDRIEFPELKELSMQEYREWQPDSFIVEKKSSGTALYQELRRIGVPVSEYTPHRGSGDKMARLNSVADIVRSGLVWIPQTRWAEMLVEEIAGFPFAEHDDLVDCTFMALARFRTGGFLKLPTDEPDEIAYFKSHRTAYY